MGNFQGCPRGLPGCPCTSLLPTLDNRRFDIFLCRLKADAKVSLLRFYFNRHSNPIPKLAQTCPWLIWRFLKYWPTINSALESIGPKKVSFSYKVMETSSKKRYLEAESTYCVSIKDTMVEAATRMSSSASTNMILFSDMNLTFWCRLDGMVLAKWIHSRPRSRLKTVGMSTTTKDT